MFPWSDQQRRDVAAIHVLHAAVGKYLENDHGGVFAHLARAEEAIHQVRDLRQRLPGEHEGMDDALQRCGDDRGRNAFAGNIGDYDAKAIVQNDGVVEVSADGMAGKAARADFGVVDAAAW